MADGSGKLCTPMFLGAPINFCKIRVLVATNVVARALTARANEILALTTAALYTAVVKAKIMCNAILPTLQVASECPPSLPSQDCARYRCTLCTTCSGDQADSHHGVLC